MSSNTQRKVEPLDDMPPMSHVIKTADLLNNANINYQNGEWLKDKSIDFYMGMFAALRIAYSGVKSLENNPNMTLDNLGVELTIFNGQIANIIIEKS